MVLPSTARALPGAPGVTAVAVPVAGLLTLRSGPLPVVWAALLALGVGWSLLRRARRDAPERDIWSRLLVTGLVLATGVLGTAVAADVLSPSPLGSLPIAVAVVVTFPAVYGGLLRWNRYSTSLADPNDVLNGCSAVLVAVAIANVVVDCVGGPLAALPDWHLQLLLGAAAAAVVYLGTAAVMTVIAGLRSDPRIWLVAGALATVCGAALLALVTADRHPGVTSGAVAVGLLLLTGAAALGPRRSTPQPADPADSTVGAFVVISIATLTLAAAALAAPSWAAICCAGLASIGSSLRLLVNVRDLSELAVSRREALTDDLTALPNRRAVLRRIEQLCAEGTPFVFGLIDLDKFKEVNDGLGHSAGDELLHMIARRLETALPTGTLIGRLGGDEFAVVAPARSTAAMGPLATRLGAGVVEQFTEPFAVAGLVLHADVSVGLATHDCADHVATSCSTQLLRRADAALYDAKRTGAAAVCWDPARHVDTSGRLALVEELRAAMAAGELVLHYQPQVAVSTGETTGVEALVRWQHPTRGLLPPADFLPLAEMHGLMAPLTERVLAQAVAQAAEWHHAGRGLRVSVNLSVSNLLDASLPRRVAELLGRHRLPASSLVLEVTETVLMSDSEASLTVLTALADLGVAVSIDDFGTGYASLSYLRELPVTELKLDRSFTADLLTDPRTEAIVSSTIELAHRLGLRVVAEGVEQPATLHRLQALGCDESQGYLHSRPVPAAELLAPARPVLQGA